MQTPGGRPTPGPWTAAGESVLAKEGLIATSHVIDGTRATLDANARLIAAAPKLLEALEEATALLTQQFKAGRLVELNSGQMQSIVEEGQAAIREAKGE